MRKLVIFDLDGTLVDTVTDVHISLNLALKQIGLPEISIDAAKRAIGPGPDEFLIHVLGKDNLHLQNEFREAFRPIYWEHCTDHATPFEGIVPLLKSLRDHGVKLAVATNKARPGTQPMLKALNLNTYFDAVLSRDDVKRPKPHPEMLLKACELVDVEPAEALMLGDTDNDILAARDAGIPSCVALWGYSHHFDELLDLAHYSAKSPQDVLTLFETEPVEHV